MDASRSTVFFGIALCGHSSRLPIGPADEPSGHAHARATFASLSRNPKPRPDREERKQDEGAGEEREEENGIVAQGGERRGMRRLHGSCRRRKANGTVSLRIHASRSSARYWMFWKHNVEGWERKVTFLILCSMIYGPVYFDDLRGWKKKKERKKKKKEREIRDMYTWKEHAWTEFKVSPPSGSWCIRNHASIAASNHPLKVS